MNTKIGMVGRPSENVSQKVENKIIDIICIVSHLNNRAFGFGYGRTNAGGRPHGLFPGRSGPTSVKKL